MFQNITAKIRISEQKSKFYLEFFERKFHNKHNIHNITIWLFWKCILGRLMEVKRLDYLYNYNYINNLPIKYTHFLKCSETEFVMLCMLCLLYIY